MLTRGVAIGLCIAAFVGSGSGRTGEKVPPLKPSVHTDRASYGLSDDINIEVRLTNRGDSPLLVYGELGWGFGGGLILRITDKGGKPVEPRHLDDDSVPPGAPSDSRNFVRLFPGHFLGTSRKDKVVDLFGRPGQYRLVVDYLSPVSAQLAQLEGLWSAEMGPVRSDTVDVTVGVR